MKVLRKNFIFLLLTFFVLSFHSFPVVSSTIIPELKKSINYQCKNDERFRNFNECRAEVLSQLNLQGTEFIYRIKNKNDRKDLILQCNLKRKNALEFNSCLFNQVSLFFNEDVTIPPPIVLETKENKNEDLVTIVTVPDDNEVSLIERLVKSTFFVEAYNEAYDGGTGSAVKINSTNLMTACHVVYDYEKKEFYKNIRVSNVDHKDEQKRFDAKVLKFDLKKDACILSSENISTYPSVPDIKDFNKLKVFEKVYGIGNPNGYVGRTVEGKITSLYKDTPYDLKSIIDPGELIETNAPMDKGNSGGGLYDQRGNLIGILSMCDIVDVAPAYPCRLENPLNWSVPVSSFKNLTKFQVEKDQIEIVDYQEKKEPVIEENKSEIDLWLYNDEATILSSTINNKFASFGVQYYWDESDELCFANLVLYHLADNESDLEKFNSIIDRKFSFEILGQQPLDFDEGFVGTVFEDYSDVSLILVSKRYEKNMFKNRFNSNGKLVVELKSSYLKNYTKKTFYSFDNLGLNELSEKAYDYCMKNKSKLG